MWNHIIAGERITGNTTLWKMYSKVKENIQVKESYFRMVFNKNYNLGFGSPQSDIVLRVSST